MTPRAKLGLSSFLPVVVFAPTGWLIGRLVGLTGAPLWIVRLGFVLLGAILAAVVYWFLKKKDEDELTPADAGTPAARIDAVIAEARRRVASAGAPRKASFGELPLVLTLGPPGSTKTTSIVRSGLEPELLAGEVLRGDAVPPTDGANVWYSNGTLIVEAGGVVSQDQDAWARLVSRVRPRRVGAALARGAQAPRAALVCVSCEALLAPDAQEALPRLARDLRARLVELSDALGIRLPVYVLFTKADRIPHFDDFVRHLTNEEARRAVGSILPVTEPVPAGAYADRQFARVNGAYELLVRSLALKRLKLLPRESDPDRATLAYEFPREVGKLRERAVAFLVELCRPSELRVSPFLRGYHFTGVRPVVVSDAAPAVPAAQGASPSSVDATMVFDALAAQRAAAPPPPSGGTRRIPQWVFLERLFREAILQDRVAQTVSAGGTGVMALRRGLLVAATAVAIVLCVGLTTSFVRNRGLRVATTAAIQDLSLEVSDPQRAASLSSLTRLDSLRQHASTLGSWEREGAPLSYRWGLYAGSSLHGAVRTAYFETFDQLLFRRTRTSLAQSLRSLPQQPDADSEYGETYDALKAYLITLRHPERSTASFLGPTLLGHWRGGDYVDEERSALARRQFEFFGEELAFGTPYPGLEADDAVVTRARSFLLEFGQADPFYRSLVSEASQANASVRLESTVLTGALELPGAFTRDGWSYVRGRLGDPESLLRTEEWVLGPGAPVPDASILVQQLDSTYRDDYSDQWEGLLASVSVVSFSNPGDAAGKLDRLAASDSPLLDLLLTASEHTASAAEDVVERFQPVYVLAPPDSAGEATVGEPVQRYLDAIAGVGNAMNAVAQADRGGQAGAVGGARAQIGNARQALRDATQGFARAPEAAPVARAIRELLTQPIDQSERLLGRLAVELPSREINQRGAAFCREFGRLVSGFPFTRDLGAPDATLQDVAAAFQPGSSALWSLYDESLQPLLDSRGDRYVARAGGPVTVVPEFVAFFDRAARISRMFYGSPGDDRPEVDFSFRPRFSERVQELTLMVDGATNRFTPISNQTLVLSWDGDPGEVRLLGRVDGVERTLLGPFSGSWALFRLFMAAEEWARDGSRYVVTWSLPVAGGPNLELEADVEAPAAVAGGELANLRCQGRIAR
jgi:type VI secretion system protein ImpL